MFIASNNSLRIFRVLFIQDKVSIQIIFTTFFIAPERVHKQIYEWRKTTQQRSLKALKTLLDLKRFLNFCNYF